HGGCLAGGAGGGRRGLGLHLAGSDATGEAAPDLPSGVQLAPGISTGPLDEPAGTVVAGCLRLEQLEHSFGAVGGPSRHQPPIALAQRLRGCHAPTLWISPTS